MKFVSSIIYLFCSRYHQFRLLLLLIVAILSNFTIFREGHIVKIGERDQSLRYRTFIKSTVFLISSAMIGASAAKEAIQSIPSDTAFDAAYHDIQDTL